MAQEETNFRRWRRECNLTQEEAAIELGLSKARIEHYDKGVSRSSGKRAVPSKAERIAMMVYARDLDVYEWPE